MTSPTTPLTGTEGPLTSGLATFLMTDIEGSTRLWEEASVAMTVALEAHDTILRAAVESHGGSVIKTTGDGLLARFDDPQPAVAAALDGQLALTEHEWPQGAPLRARMAVHSGSAQARDGDYFGPALNRVARLLAIGHGGQVLLSGITATLVSDHLPEDASLIDRGDQRLRDLDQPMRVYELAGPGLARDFAPLRSLGSGRSNLPIQLTSFVGREREQVDVLRLLETDRLVTLIGTGGTGKTRLMLEVAGGLVDAYPDGVWLVELATVADPASVTAEVARALGVPDEAHATIDVSLANYLRFKSMLLLLDNCEHVIGAAAALAESLLETSASLTVMATSREALGVPGETIVQVPSLAVPPDGWRGQETLHAFAEPHEDTSGRWSFEALAASDSVRLFTERAMAVAPAFELTPANAPVVAEICQRLDGIPLAIELAAARVPVLSVGEILQRLGDRFRLLTGGRRTAVPRQQTLQALIDWSWDLLPDEDRRLLRRLSVFSGGWTLEAATAVCGGATTDDASDREPDSLAVLDALTLLVERSLVVVERGSSTRYRLLETIRQYARDRLVESGETDTIRARHLAFFLDLSQRAERDMRGPAFVDWLQRLDADADNLRLAIDWGLESDPETGIRMCVALWLLWRIRWGAELEGWFDRAVAAARELPPPPPQARLERDILIARVCSEAAFTQATWTNRDARELADEGLARARATGDLPTISQGLAAAWTARLFAGRPEELLALGEESVELAGRAGDPWTQAMAAASLAGALSMGRLRSAAQADQDHARSLMEDATRYARMSSDGFAMAFVALIRGRIAGAAGRIDEARAAFQEAATFYAEIGDSRFGLVGLSDLGHAVRRAGELEEALSILRRTLPEWAHFGNRGAIANQLEAFGFIAVERGETDRAARLLGAADTLRELSGATMLPYERAEYDVLVAQLRASMSTDAFEAAWASGRTMSAGDAVAFALES